MEEHGGWDIAVITDPDTPEMAKGAVIYVLMHRLGIKELRMSYQEFETAFADVGDLTLHYENGYLVATITDERK